MNFTHRQYICLHSMMCVVGGYLGAYAILNRGGNLGSAQTANLIYIFLYLLGRNLPEFILRVAGMLLYLLAIEIYVILSKKTPLNMERYGIYIDMVGLFVLCLIPADANPAIGILPLFFMMSTQWCIFHGTKEFASSTIFSTNNFKQTVLALSEYHFDKDRKHLRRAKFFGNSLIWYHLGVVFSFFAVKYFGIRASLFCLIPCFFALLFASIDLKEFLPFLQVKNVRSC